MIWLQFLVTALVIVLAGERLARYGDILGEKTGLGRSWIGVVLLAATTSLPELFTGIGATVIFSVPDIAVGDVLGSCMFNLLILSFMDAIHPEAISGRAHQSHALAIGFGILMLGIAGLGAAAGSRMPGLASIGAYTPLLIAVYFIAMRMVFTHERRIRAKETQEIAEELRYSQIDTRSAVLKYSAAALVVVGAALWLPQLGSEVARRTGLGEAFVGSLFVALTTSLPEVVVSLAAVRIGAIDLGVGNLLGSNLFNLLILAVDDLLYGRSPILADVHGSHTITILAAMAMNGIFLVGLTYRVITKRFAIAWDTGAIAALWVAAVSLSYFLRN